MSKSERNSRQPEGPGGQGIVASPDVEHHAGNRAQGIGCRALVIFLRQHLGRKLFAATYSRVRKVPADKIVGSGYGSMRAPLTYPQFRAQVQGQLRG